MIARRARCDVGLCAITGAFGGLENSVTTVIGSHTLVLHYRPQSPFQGAEPSPGLDTSTNNTDIVNIPIVVAPIFSFSILGVLIFKKKSKIKNFVGGASPSGYKDRDSFYSCNSFVNLRLEYNRTQRLNLYTIL